MRIFLESQGLPPLAHLQLREKTRMHVCQPWRGLFLICFNVSVEVSKVTVFLRLLNHPMSYILIVAVSVYW